MFTRISRTTLIILGTIVALLVGFRIALPTILTSAVNRQLATNPEYEGRIRGVNIALFRGAYVINDLELIKRGSNIPVTFLAIDEIDLSVQWAALLRGQVVAEVELYHPVLNFVNGPTDAQKQAGGGVDWRVQMKQLVPLEISRFAVYGGEVHYADFSTTPTVDVFADLLEVEATNLTNTENRTGTMVAQVEASCRPMKIGSLTANVSLDPYADQPTFDLNAKLLGLDLTRVNSFISAYGKVDIERGTLEVFTEVAAREGRLVGYVKPMLSGVRVLDLRKEIERDREGPLRIAWEVLVGGAKGLLTNDESGRMAVKVEFDGPIGGPQVATWEAVLSTLKNAFIEAMARGLDEEISLSLDGQG